MRVHPGIASSGRAKPGRSRSEHLSHRVVELPDARESGGKCDVRGGQLSRLEQNPRRLGPLGPGERYRACSDLRDENAVQLSFGIANAPSEARYALPVDDAVRDQPQRAPSEVASNIPLRRAGGCIRTAPLAGSITRPLSGRGSGVKRDIAPARRTRRARRPAIDTGRTHGNEEPPVES